MSLPAGGVVLHHCLNESDGCTEMRPRASKILIEVIEEPGVV